MPAQRRELHYVPITSELCLSEWTHITATLSILVCMRTGYGCILILLFGLFGLFGCQRSAPLEPAEKAVNVSSVIEPCHTLEACEQQCSAGQPAACVAAGRIYEFGHGVTPDAARAFKAYERSCSLGYAGGCYNVAVLLESGLGTTKDTARARDLYARVCKLGGTSACAHAEALVGGGPGTGSGPR